MGIPQCANQEEDRSISDPWHKPGRVDVLGHRLTGVFWHSVPCVGVEVRGCWARGGARSQGGALSCFSLLSSPLGVCVSTDTHHTRDSIIHPGLKQHTTSLVNKISGAVLEFSIRHSFTKPALRTSCVLGPALETAVQRRTAGKERPPPLSVPNH